MILPDIRKCYKPDQIMGANRYSCFRSLSAIRQPLWLKNSHNMPIFTHFSAFSVTLLAVVTTVVLTLGIGRTPILVRHVGWGYRAIFALSRHMAMARGAKKWLFF